MKFNINNCNRFGQLKFALLEDDRFSEHTHGKYEAAVLYAMIENQISLSQDTYENGNSKYYDEESKKCFCIITEKGAKNFKMSSSTFKTRKKFLQEAGLISFKEQTVKKEGVATLIFVTDFTEWVEQNGLYINGEWHVTPSSENYFNPTKHKSDEKIVKVAPKIKKKKEIAIEPVKVEQEQQEPTEEENLKEYESIMTEAKSLGVKFYNDNRMSELKKIIEKHLGVGKRFTDSTVKDLVALRSSYEEMQKAFYSETDALDF